MLLQPSLTYIDQDDRKQILDLYAMYLVQRHTIQCRSIKSKTMARYLKTGADIVIRHKLLYLQTNQRGLKSRCITKVLVEVKRCECMPNRREPVTTPMVLHMQAKCVKLHPEILDSSLCDYNFLGLKCDFHLSEWTLNCADKQTPLVNADGLPTAFTFEEMTFYRE